MLASFAILDNAFSIISSSQTCLWLCLGHKIYYLISTHGKKRIDEGSCVPRMNCVYISAKTSIVTPWGSGVQGKFRRLWVWDDFLHWEMPQWEVARKHAIVNAFHGGGKSLFVFSFKKWLDLSVLLNTSFGTSASVDIWCWMTNYSSKIFR